MDTAITVNGNITRDLDLRETEDGTPVLTIPLAVNRRRKVNVRQIAKNAAASFSVGDRVLAHGRLNQRDYTDRKGVDRRVTEVAATVVAADLTFTTVEIPPRHRGE